MNDCILVGRLGLWFGLGLVILNLVCNILEFIRKYKLRGKK